MLHGRLMLGVMMTVMMACTAATWAQDKPVAPTCHDQLMDAQMQAHNLDEHRDAIERERAKLQRLLYQEVQKVQTLEKQLADTKKALESKTDKLEKPASGAQP